MSLEAELQSWNDKWLRREAEMRRLTEENQELKQVLSRASQHVPSCSCTCAILPASTVTTQRLSGFDNTPITTAPDNIPTVTRSVGQKKNNKDTTVSAPLLTRQRSKSSAEQLLSQVEQENEEPAFQTRRKRKSSVRDRNEQKETRDNMKGDMIKAAKQSITTYPIRIQISPSQLSSESQPLELLLEDSFDSSDVIPILSESSRTHLMSLLNEVRSLIQQAHLSKAAHERENDQHQHQVACYDEALRSYDQARDKIQSALNTHRIGMPVIEETPPNKNNISSALIHSLIIELTVTQQSEAAVYAKLNDITRAETLIRAVITQRPHWYKGHSSLGTIYWHQHKYSDAQQSFETALQCNINEQEKQKLLKKLQAAETAAANTLTVNNRDRSASPTTTVRNRACQISPLTVRVNDSNQPLMSRSPVPPLSAKDISSKLSSADQLITATPRKALAELDMNTMGQTTDTAGNTSTSTGTGTSNLRKDLNRRHLSSLPILTAEGIRDLVGEEAFAAAMKLVEDKKVHQFRITPDRTVHGRCRIHDLKSNLSPTKPLSQADSGKKRQQPRHTAERIIEQKMVFNEARCIEWNCECMNMNTEKQTTADELINSATSSSSSSSLSSSSSAQHLIPLPGNNEMVWKFAACEHIAAVLLTIRDIQTPADEHMDVTTDNASRPSLYVNPARLLSSNDRLTESNLRHHYSGMTVSQLTNILQRNNQKRSGLKAELVSRCVEAELRGALPKCPLCQQGNLFYAAGIYRCRGVFDPINHQYIRCDFVARDVQRLPWKL